LTKTNPTPTWPNPKQLAFKRHADWSLYLAIVLILGLIRFFFTRVAFDDEARHLAQIDRFIHGDLRPASDLAMTPGYHAFMALVTKLLGTTSLEAMRTVNVVISAVCIGTFAMLLRQVHGRVPAQRLIQFSFFPIILPYYFLVYSDIFSLLLVLTAMLLALRRQHFFAALAAIAGVTVRQTNIVWLVLAPVLAYCMHNDFALRRAPIVGFMKTGWFYALGVFGFALFVYWNRGVAIGEKTLNPAFSFHLGNIYFFLALYGVFFLPRIVGRRREIALFIRDHRYTGAALAPLFALYLLGFQADDHPDNRFAPKFFLRNRILMSIAASPLIKIVAFLPMGLAALDILATSVRKREIWLVLLFTTLALVPAWLVEQRYYIIPFALLLLLRGEERPKVEMAMSLSYVALSTIFIYGIQNHYFFL
jgi:alpha-1,2-glucosyltransferase